MAVARTLQSLHIYDILANLLPGSMLLISFISIMEIERYFGRLPSSLLIAIFIVVGFVGGHIIQAFASKLNGKPRLFGLLVSEIRGIKPYNPDGTFEFLPQRIREWFGFQRSVLSDIDVTEVEEDFWPMAKSQFDLTDDFEHHGRLMQLMLSYLETVQATRALRFQSIHTFHRSMWGMWFLSLLLVLIVSIGAYFELIAARSPLILAMTGVTSLLGIWIFGKRKEKFNKKVVEYTIVDFYIQKKSD